jgi:hypothetical protein
MPTTYQALYGFISGAALIFILAEFVMGRACGKASPEEKPKKLNRCQWGFACVMMFGSFLLLKQSLPIFVPCLGVGAVLGYLVFALLDAASGGAHLPGKKPALVVMPCLVFSLIFLFAKLYLASQEISVGKECNTTELLAGRFNAVYFSTSVFTTLGDDNFHVCGRFARTMILFQQFSSFLSLACAFAILISRLAMLESDSVKLANQRIVVTIDGVLTIPGTVHLAEKGGEPSVILKLDKTQATTLDLKVADPKSAKEQSKPGISNEAEIVISQSPPDAPKP